MVRGKAEKDEGDGAWEAVRRRGKRVKVEAKKRRLKGEARRTGEERGKGKSKKEGQGARSA